MYLGVMLSQTVDGAKLRNLRERHGTSVSALAEAAGCSNWNIYRIESGNGQPSPEVYGRIKAALSATDDDLLVQEGAA